MIKNGLLSPKHSPRTLTNMQSQSEVATKNITPLTKNV